MDATYIGARILKMLDNPKKRGFILHLFAAFSRDARLIENGEGRCALSGTPLAGLMCFVSGMSKASLSECAYEALKAAIGAHSHIYTRICAQTPIEG